MGIRSAAPQTWDRATLLEALRAQPFQLSGTYAYEGGAHARGRRTISETEWQKYVQFYCPDGTKYC